MRIGLIGVIALVAAAAATVEPASAQRRNGPPPWCNQGNYMTGGIMDCSYYTLEQCLISASGVGGGCITNPAYEWARRYPRRPYERRY